jgi:hypothetical protein
MRRLVVTSKLQRAYRKLIKRERALQSRIDDVLRQMEWTYSHPIWERIS